MFWDFNDYIILLRTTATRKVSDPHAHQRMLSASPAGLRASCNLSGPEADLRRGQLPVACLLRYNRVDVGNEVGGWEGCGMVGWWGMDAGYYYASLSPQIYQQTSRCDII